MTIKRTIRKLEKKVVKSILTGIVNWFIDEFSQNDPIAVPRYYMILHDKHGKAISIKCLTCGKTSSNKYDIKHKYCSHCKQFH